MVEVKMNTCAFLVSILSAVTTSMYLDLTKEWGVWKLEYGKNYSSHDEEQFRMEIWKENWKKIQEHNKQADEGKKSYWMATNHFSDMTSEESLSHCCMPLREQFGKYTVKNETKNQSPLLQHVDWRQKGCVTAAKNQNTPNICSSCWIFSAVGAIESHICIKTGHLNSLSEQQIMDCGRFAYPCLRDYPENALRYIQTARGLMKDKDYPYKATKLTCQIKNELLEKIARLQWVFIDSEAAMASTVQQDGPLIFGMNVKEDFIHYRTGIYDTSECNESNGHAMVIVGFGHENGLDYWLVKNSWGTAWGENGFGKIRRNAGLCDITQHVLDISLEL